MCFFFADLKPWLQVVYGNDSSSISSMEKQNIMNRLPGCSFCSKSPLNHYVLVNNLQKCVFISKIIRPRKSFLSTQHPLSPGHKHTLWASSRFMSIREKHKYSALVHPDALITPSQSYRILCIDEQQSLTIGISISYYSLTPLKPYSSVDSRVYR